MEKVVILARVSTDKQEYERQITELAEHCRKMGWEVVRIFANKVSGAKTNEEREEIQELIEFVKTHQIQRVVCLEISRMGRNTLEALKVIQLLNEHKVSLYVKNYNLRLWIVKARSLEYLLQFLRYRFEGNILVVRNR